MNRHCTETSRYGEFISLLNRKPDAAAIMEGGEKYPGVSGYVRFYQTDSGVLVTAEMFGLPRKTESGNGSASCCGRVFALHLHEGNSCAGMPEAPFEDAMAHYNPGHCPHPYHAGDMPSVFGSNGYGFEMFFTNRFCVSEIIGKAMILHANPDDFTTQPSGNSGEKIACGIVRPLCSCKRNICGNRC